MVDGRLGGDPGLGILDARGAGTSSPGHRERKCGHIFIVRMPFATLMGPHVVLHGVERGRIIAGVRLQGHLQRLEFGALVLRI